MRKATMFKNLVSGVIVLSLTSPALAATVRKNSKAAIDNEIQTLAGNENKKSKAKVQAAKRKQAVKAQALKKQAPAESKLTRESFVSQANPAAAVAAPAESLSFDSSSNPATTVTSVKAEEVKPAEAKSVSYSGAVGITIGKDSNATVEKKVTPEVAPVAKGSFYQIAPTLGFKGQLFSGNFGASIKDWSNQKLSDTAKETVINADMAANYDVAVMKATTKVDFENNDSQWPDYLGGTKNGMPLRYFQSSISQSLATDFGMLNVKVEGSFTNKDYTTPYSDNWSDDHIFGYTVFEQDQLISKGSMRVGAKLNDVFEIAVRPMIKHTKFTKEPARQTDGTKGGAAFNDTTPRREVTKQEGNIDLNITAGRFTLAPTATFGNDTDEALGALDTTYSGGGVKAEVVIDPATALKLSSTFNYKKIEYDNWTYNGFGNVIPNGEKRKDTEKTTTVSAGVNINKNVGVSVDYTLIEEVSNWETADENYDQEIIGSTLNITF